jgi:putative transposase
MPSGLHRFQQAGQLHFVTFSCDGRKPHLGSAARRDRFKSALERVRGRFRWAIPGYVVMPEHVYLLVKEPGRRNLAQGIQALKTSVTVRVPVRPFWLERYYDFNVWPAEKVTEKLR